MLICREDAVPEWAYDTLMLGEPGTSAMGLSRRSPRRVNAPGSPVILELHDVTVSHSNHIYLIASRGACARRTVGGRRAERQRQDDAS